MGRATVTSKDYHTAVEQQTVTALIISTDVLTRLYPLLNGEAFGTKWSNIISRWCVQFYDEHKTAPGKAVFDIYAKWAENGDKDNATAEMAGSYLALLMEEYDQRKEEVMPDYAVSKAVDHFGRVSSRKLSENVQECVQSNDIVKIQEITRTFVLPSIGGNGGTDVCNDFDAVRSACEYSEKPPIVEYPAGLGDFFGDSLREDSFIAFTGSDKSGKSTWLMDMAFRAMCQRKKVVFFEAGDMSKDQVMGRFLSRVSKRPLYPCSYSYPEGMNTNGKTADVQHTDYRCDKHLNAREAWGHLKKLTKDKIKSSQGYFRLFNYTTGTLKVEEMRSVIQGLCRTGFVPEVVVVDYADILCPPSTGKNDDMRAKTDLIWIQLAALRLEYHCLVVTATQANAKAYGAETLTKQNFSDNKKKNAHVTGMIGISTTAAEKEMGVSRLNWMLRRDRAFNDQKCCIVAGCLAIANPAIHSVF